MQFILYIGLEWGKLFQIIGVCYIFKIIVLKGQYKIITELYSTEVFSKEKKYLFVWFLLCCCQFGSSQDLGGCTVCHLASETDTKSFGCDLFELMVQNIVSTPTGNFIGALGQCKWPIVYLSGQHTLARPDISAHFSMHIHLYMQAVVSLDLFVSLGGHTGQC